MKNFLKLSFIVLMLIRSFSLAAEEKRYDSDEYSTIKTDGQLIPVGEKNRYKNSYNTWQIWSNPFGYFWGKFNIGVSYAINQNIKINAEPEFIYYFAASPKVVGFGGTLSSTIFFKKMYDGFYLEPGGQILYLSQKQTVGSNDVTGTVGGPQLVGGWGWVWDSGFTVNLGMGVGYFWGKVGRNVKDTDSFEGVVPVGNLQFGYTF
jgi:hypothetical protein